METLTTSEEQGCSFSGKRRKRNFLKDNSTLFVFMLKASNGPVSNICCICLIQYIYLDLYCIYCNFTIIWTHRVTENIVTRIL